MVDLEPKTVRLATDDMDRVAEFQEREGCTEAEAFRRLLRAGLDAEGVDGDDGPITTRAGFDPIGALHLLLWFLSAVIGGIVSNMVVL